MLSGQKKLAQIVGDQLVEGERGFRFDQLVEVEVGGKSLIPSVIRMT